MKYVYLIIAFVLGTLLLPTNPRPGSTPTPPAASENL